MANTENRSELSLRIIFGVAMAIVAVGLTWIGGTIFEVFAGLLSLVMFYEYTRICAKSLPANIAITALAFLVIIELSWINGEINTVLWVGIFAPLIICGWEIIIRRSSWGAMGLIYCVLPFLALVQMRWQSEEGFFVILLVFAYVWGADTFAYIVGRTLKGPKLAPKLSPGKTWSGFFGGLIGALGLSWLLMISLGYELNLLFYMVSIIVIVTSQLGDLFESGLKRIFSVKDSSNLIPGHGGVLDRVDGFIFAIVSSWLIAMTGAYHSQGTVSQNLPGAYMQMIVN